MINIVQYLLFFVLSCYASIDSHPNKLFHKSSSKDVFDSGVCFQEAVCQPLQNITCFGTALPYTMTSMALAEDSVSLFEAQDNLAFWEGLRTVPRCWAVVQPLLCGVYMPKCENNTVSLPSQEMCRITRAPCRAVEVKHSWPPFLDCDNKELFPPRCKNPLQGIKFNTSYKCISPLVETDNPESWFEGVDGCGLQCQDPLFTEKEHEDTHSLVFVFALISLATTAFCVATFVISWQSAKNYPGKIIFFINLNLMLVSIGWLLQFFPGARDTITCALDGTVRVQQPRSGNQLCTITFILVYYFMMGSLIWFIILSYGWYMLFREKGAAKDTVQKKASCFHVAAICIPLLLSVIVVAVNGVDGDSLSGICFVGYSNFLNRVLFLLVPLGVTALVSTYFLICVLRTLIKVKLESEEVTTEKSRSKLRCMIIKISIFSLFAVILLLCTLACHAYDFMNRAEWNESLREYIVCLAMNSAQANSEFAEYSITKCALKVRPNLKILQLHLFCSFGFSVVMSSWVWTRATFKSWKRYFYRLCAPKERKSNIKKHELIAKAFQRRHQLNQGHYSMSFNSTHGDPVGMQFDGSSVTSRDISSSWAMALPQFITRRNAVAGFQPSYAPRQYSSVSDVSQQISVDSYNQPPNPDSLSMQISEHEFFAHALRHQRRKTKKERERLLKANRFAPWFPGNRRGSDTSLQSASLVAAAAAAAAKVTKSTSTGDLGGLPMLALPQALPPTMPSSRNTFHRDPVIPPFTHGMTDNSHLPPAVATQQQQRGTPLPAAYRNTIGGLGLPFAYPQNFPPMPYGYLQAGMYPGYACAAGFNFPALCSTMPYAAYGSYPSVDESVLIPMQPRPDSASETQYFPIVMSDSEFTDTSHMSVDEARLIQRLLPTMTQVRPPQTGVARPGLEPQQCAKTQFLSRLDKCKPAKPDTPPEVRPPSGRKSPHSAVPPPSPAESVKSATLGDDDVFEEEEDPKEVQEAGVLQKLKSKFKRATSFTKNPKESPEGMELSPRPASMPPGKNTTSGEKCLNPSERIGLMGAKDGNENVSR